MGQKASISCTDSAIRPKQSPKPKIKEATVHSNDWLCAVCRNKIVSDSSRFFYEGSSQFEFTNPSNELFLILTFSNVCGCRESGLYTMDYTWFEGHEWANSLCSQCGMQLGWKYRGKHTFHGLIRSRLARGFTAFN